MFFDTKFYLFQFQKHLALRVGNAIAAQAQFLLIDRFLQTPADEPEIWSVQIEVSDGAVAVYIGTQILPGGGEQPGLLVPGQQIFELIPLKDGLIFHCEILLVLEW